MCACVEYKLCLHTIPIPYADAFYECMPKYNGYVFLFFDFLTLGSGIKNHSGVYLLKKKEAISPRRGQEMAKIFPFLFFSYKLRFAGLSLR